LTVILNIITNGQTQPQMMNSSQEYATQAHQWHVYPLQWENLIIQQEGLHVPLLIIWVSLWPDQFMVSMKRHWITYRNVIIQNIIQRSDLVPRIIPRPARHASKALNSKEFTFKLESYQ